MKNRLNGLLEVEKLKNDFAASSGRQEIHGERLIGRNWDCLKKDLQAFSNTGHRRWGSDTQARRKSVLKLTGSVLANVSKLGNSCKALP